MLTIILIAVGVLVVGGSSVAYYFYEFHVFESVRVCVGGANDTGVPCVDTQECFDLAKEAGVNIDTELEGLPEFAREIFDDVVDEAVYCDGTCFVRNVRGINADGEIEMIESCDVGEVEFVVDIRGKEALELMKYMKNRE